MKTRFIALAAFVVLASSIFAGTSLASAKSGEQNGDSLAIVHPGGGAYVIVTDLTADTLNFNFGWNNTKAFTSEPVSYWIGVYHETASHYEWSDEVAVTGEAPLKLKMIDTTDLVSGDLYKINFFVRGEVPGENVAEIVLYFTAP